MNSSTAPDARLSRRVFLVAAAAASAATCLQLPSTPAVAAGTAAASAPRPHRTLLGVL